MNEKYVVEYCSNCETENEFRWDVEEEGFKAYCPHCGAVLMLCDECVHREDAPWVCTTESTPERECARTMKMLAESEEHKMNYMEKIADMLGVELGEKFKIRFHGSIDAEDETYFLKEDYGLCDITGDHIRNDYLGALLTGRCKIVKLPWKPKNGEIAYYIDADRKMRCIEFSDLNCKDLVLYKLGKLYRTREEAEVHVAEDEAFWDQIRKEIEE